MDIGVVDVKLCNNTLFASENCSIANISSTESFKFKPEAVAVPLTFAIIFLVGITGNILLTLNFAWHKKLSTIHNALVVNLAAGDILILIVGLPFNSLLYTLPFWPFGEVLCKLSKFAETTATAVTIATLAILSIERFMIVTGRRRRRRRTLSPSVPLVLVVVVWVTSFLLALPDLISASIGTVESRTGEILNICFDFRRSWGPLYPKINVACRFLLLFVIPLLVIAPCYIGLALHLIFKMFNARGTPTSKTPLTAAVAANPTYHERQEVEENSTRVHTNGSQENLQKQRSEGGENESNNAATVLNNFPKRNKTPMRKRRRLAVTVLGLALVFVMCWLPRHVYLLWFYFDPSYYNDFWHVFKIVAFCLMFANSALNPFVFYVLDARFRDYVHSALLCRRRKRRASSCRGDGWTQETMAERGLSITDDKKGGIALGEMRTSTDRVDAV